jgi:hypothetical protein
MSGKIRVCLLALLVVLGALRSNPQTKRKVIIDQDAAGPGGTGMQSIVALINSPDTEVLGITVLTGDAWRDEELQHTLRLLEIIGRPDIPVLPGAVFPLVNSKEHMLNGEKTYGKQVYMGAWNFAKDPPFTGRTKFRRCRRARRPSRLRTSTLRTSCGAWCGSTRMK